MNGPKREIIRGELSNRKMYAGDISYVSECSFGFSCRVSAEAVSIAVIETSKMERMLADIVEDLIRWEVVGALKR